MSAAVELKIGGLDGTLRALDALPESVRNHAISRAVKIAGEPILAGMVNRCPVRYGILRNSLTAFAKKLRDGVTFVCRIGAQSKIFVEIDTISRGPRKGQVFGEVPTRIIKLVEFGTSKREATPFMRPALEAQAQNAVGAFQAEMENQIDIAVEKVAFRGTT